MKTYIFTMFGDSFYLTLAIATWVVIGLARRGN